MRLIFGLAALTALASCSIGDAQDRFVTGGLTSVVLDTATLSSVGLDLSGVSSSVVVPGELGNDSVGFTINSRTGNLPTTFAYTLTSLAPFSGSIEHDGSVFFNNDTVEVGNFTVGFDAARVGGVNSGFFVESTVGISAILFDIENPDSLSAGATELTISANLLVSPEFASFLGNSGLTGVDVGDSLVRATAVPEPAAISLLGLAGGFLFMSRRRRTV